MCCLKPGVKGLSENIHVRSIVGRFLEHTRCYYFLNEGKEEVFCASADLMARNLFKRVEECYPVENSKLKKRIIDNLNIYLQDNTQAWMLHSEGNYSRLQPQDDETPISAQQSLLEV